MSKTKTRRAAGAQSLGRGGKLLNGSPVKAGDVLYSRRTGTAKRVIGFKKVAGMRKARLQDRVTGVETLASLSYIGKQYVRSFTDVTFRG